MLSVQSGCRSSNVLVSYSHRFDFAQSDRFSTTYSAPFAASVSVSQIDDED